MSHALNGGRLSDRFYAMIEPGDTTAKPRVRFTATAEVDVLTARQRTLVVRHASDDRIVALIEILSPGNKASKHALRAFVDKAVAALERGYHLLLIDIQPPTPRDMQGIHGAIWEEINGGDNEAPAGQPLTLVAYEADRPRTAYIEPIGLGDRLPDMPLFLEPGAYVPVPLEATYLAAYRGVPKRWRDGLEPPAAG